MSEMAPEAGGGGGGGNFLTRKYAGIPGFVILIGVALLAYLFFRSRSGSASSPNSTSGSGQQTTGDISVGATSPNITINAPYANTQSNSPTITNPQPTPPPKPPSKKNITKAGTGYVTVAPHSATSTPWNSTLAGISNITGVSIAELLKLNPQINTTTEALLPGEKVKY